jgi:hypothetical protein
MWIDSFVCEFHAARLETGGKDIMPSDAIVSTVPAVNKKWGIP